MKHPDRRAEVDAQKRVEHRDHELAVLGTGWRADYGYLLVTVDHDRTRHYEDIPPGTSYEQASLIHREAVANAGPRCRYVDLVKKSFDPVALDNFSAGRTRPYAHDPRSVVAANPFGYTDDLVEDAAYETE